MVTLLDVRTVKKVTMSAIRVVIGERRMVVFIIPWLLS